MLVYRFRDYSHLYRSSTKGDAAGSQPRSVFIHSTRRSGIFCRADGTPGFVGVGDIDVQIRQLFLYCSSNGGQPAAEAF